MTLAASVQQLQDRLSVDVCSIYLLESDRTHLVLAATVGLRPESVGVIRMALHEGLTGLVAERLRPVAVANVKRHRRFKPFVAAGEEAYHGFLGVPLMHQDLLQGVLIVQTRAERRFSDDEIDALTTAAFDVSPIVARARERSQFIAPLHARLWTLAHNLWWSWDPGATNLFHDLATGGAADEALNPVALLATLPLGALEQRIREKALESRINHTYRRLQEYLTDTSTWGGEHVGALRERPVAYFSAEFGIHESVPIYSGGLGVLAGDHIKSASDLDVPLVGIGLFYGQGYFRQRLDAAGWQQEDYSDVNLRALPLEPACDRHGAPIALALDTRDGSLQARVWRAQVGRRTLLLLDSDVEGNTPADRQLTARLYGGDERVRIRQELLLGVGGLRALHAMAIVPAVLHLNEGHSAFALLEAARYRIDREGVDFETAARHVARRTVFTTHTPVDAGHDRFGAALMEEHLGPLREQLGISADQLLDLGRVESGNTGEAFCMTVLGLKLAASANAVSSLHGEVTRRMWSRLWPARTEEEIPIGHITNGVHVPSWLAPQMQHLYDRHLPPAWAQPGAAPAVWRGIDGVNDGTLWETHVALKTQLLDFVRRRAVREAEQRGEPTETVKRLAQALAPDALTIGFARRFATYKRATLFLADLDRLTQLVNDPQRPVQFVFAGKAHPRDDPGKQLLRRIHEISRDPRFFGKVIFIEDYDIHLGRHLVRGVDVWLNNPRRPMEASGTSGQKVVLNGGLNLSVRDGWWAEAYDGMNGFAIGAGDTHTDDHVHDRRDADALVATLVETVIPLYYDRDEDGVPRAWTARMKRAIRTLGWRFSADRMVRDYAQLCYVPAAGGSSSDIRRP